MSFINRIRTLAFFLLLLSFYSTWAESKSQYPDGFSFVEYVNNFVVNIGPEVAGIAITVLLIDYLSEKRDDQQRVQRESELYLQNRSY